MDDLGVPLFLETFKWPVCSSPSCFSQSTTPNSEHDSGRRFSVALWGLPHYKDLFLDDSEEWEEFEPEKTTATPHQWPFQEPKMEVPTIYKAYIRPM